MAKTNYRTTNRLKTFFPLTHKKDHDLGPGMFVVATVYDREKKRDEWKSNAKGTGIIYVSHEGFTLYEPRGKSATLSPKNEAKVRFIVEKPDFYEAGVEIDKRTHEDTKLPGLVLAQLDEHSLRDGRRLLYETEGSMRDELRWSGAKGLRERDLSRGAYHVNQLALYMEFGGVENVDPRAVRDKFVEEALADEVLPEMGVPEASVRVVAGLLEERIDLAIDLSREKFDRRNEGR